MNNVFNREREPWLRPWNLEKFDDLYNRDERFFSLVIKGLLSWLNRNIVLYNKPINHFIFNTGSSYLYIESNGYEYTLSETSGEDTMYMTLPRCLIELSDINIPMEELSAPFSRGNYERRSGNQLQGFNAEMRRLPIELTVNMKYYLSNFNETIILLQELIDKLVFQRYYNITYLGKVIQCSIEFPANYNPEINKIDMSSPEPNQRNLTFDIKICANYPLIDVRTEIPTDKVIASFGHEIDLYLKGFNSDPVKKGNVINNEIDHYDNFVSDDIQESEDIINAKPKSDNNPDTPIDDNPDNPDNPDTPIDDNPDNPDNPDTPIDDDNNPNIFDEDANITLEELIQKHDTNNDGLVNEIELIEMLDAIKYGKYDKQLDYVEGCHYQIDYEDIYNAIKLINKQKEVSANYDRFTNKIYVTNNETGDTKEIDIKKYKAQIK